MRGYPKLPLDDVNQITPKQPAAGGLKSNTICLFRKMLC